MKYLYMVWADTAEDSESYIDLWFIGLYENEEDAKAHASAYKHSDVIKVEINHTYIPWTEDGLMLGEYCD